MRISVSAFIKAGAFAFAALPSFTSAAWIHFDPSDTAKVPKKFSQTGFYTNITAKNKVTTSEAVPFEVNSPQWSDNAVQQRWIVLNSAAEKVTFDPAEDYWAYPEGTVFVKLFRHDTVAGDTSSRIYWETQILIKKKRAEYVNSDPVEVVLRDSWFPFSYKWNAAGTDADLISNTGDLDTTLYVWIKGVRTFRKWSFFSENKCNSCHRPLVWETQGRTVLGFFAAQLNRKNIPRAGANQIRELFARNILSWPRPAPPTEAELDTMPRWARLTDSAASLDLRARSYLGSNCSGCHGTRGLATSSAIRAMDNYDFFRMTPAMELRNYATTSPDSWGLDTLVTPKGDSLFPKLIVPGYPQISYLLQRLKYRNRLDPANPEERAKAFYDGKRSMPTLGVFEEDTLANKVVEDWILAMVETTGANHQGLAGRGAPEPSIKGGILTLPSGLRGKVVLTGLDGRSQPVIRLNESTFRLPHGMKPGVYLLMVGVRSFKLIL